VIAPKVVDIFPVYRGDVVVCTESNGARHSWTVTDEAIFGGGIIFGVIETEDHNVYRRVVLNYDIDNHPSKRPRVYTGEEEHIVHAAIDQSIGLLSTVELHRIIVAVKQGRISKPEARAVLRKPGRIEFDGGPSQKA
jgi:hypothetical protein